MKKVEKVTLVFENCEMITFPAEMFDILSLENISTSINNIAHNYIAKMDVCNNILFQLNTKAVEYIEQLSKIPYGEQGEDCCLFVFEGETYNKKRLVEFSDITSIECYYEKETKDIFYTSWGDGEYSNPNQTSYLIESEENQFKNLNGVWISIHEDQAERELNLFTRMFYSIIFSKDCKIDISEINIRTPFEEIPKKIIDQVKTLLKDNFNISFETI